MDESGIEDSEDYPYGYSLKGQRFYALKSGAKTKRVSMIAAFNNKKLKAPMIFEGYGNTRFFEAGVKQQLVPILEKGQTVIWDNASFHKSRAIEKAIADAGCELLRLPPYSPDLNDIEHEWFPIKNKIRKSISRFNSFGEAVDYAFM